MSLRILIVDDSAIIRAIIKKTVSMSGLDVEEIFEGQNGHEALEILRKEWIDVVFCDLNMPEMTGDELVAEMSNDRVLVSIPVVVVSSERNEERIEELRKNGIKAYIKKPFKPEEFRDVVGEVLGLTTIED
jgi:two-component system, chemotaxis family, chemotaxis protein CheY